MIGLGVECIFWENDPQRALKWAEDTMLHRQNEFQSVKTPSVIGAVICLGKCLDLMSIENLEKLKSTYEILQKQLGEKLPKNTCFGLKRNLDCLVINTFISLQKNQGIKYDSVRGVFFEGKELYQNAGFREKNHIQIAVLNPNCIKGYFLPKDLNLNFPEV